MTRPPPHSGDGSGSQPAGTRRALTRPRSYDVYGSSCPGGPRVHLGALDAADAEFARLYATQAYGRRGENTDLLILEKSSALDCERYVRVLEHHVFRRVLGHSRRQWRELQGEEASADERGGR